MKQLRNGDGSEHGVDVQAAKLGGQRGQVEVEEVASTKLVEEVCNFRKIARQLRLFPCYAPWGFGGWGAHLGCRNHALMDLLFHQE